MMSIPIATRPEVDHAAICYTALAVVLHQDVAWVKGSMYEAVLEMCLSCLHKMTMKRVLYANKPFPKLFPGPYTKC